jgi:general stress protein 26
MMDKLDRAAKEKVRELIKDTQFAMLATRGPDGSLHARPMATSEVDFDGTLWFLTDARSGKIEDLADDPEVLVTYADEARQNYVSVTGQGTVMRDPAKVKELWSEWARVWFPEGPTDPNIALIKVTVESAEYWDSPSSTMLHIYGYGKALATGRRPERPGDHGRVSY